MRDVQLPIGSISAFHWNFQATQTSFDQKIWELYALGWELCDGQPVQHPESPMHGHLKPNLCQSRFPLGTLQETGKMNASSEDENQPHHQDGRVQVTISADVTSQTTGTRDEQSEVHGDSRTLLVGPGTLGDGSPIVSEGHMWCNIEATPPYTTVWWIIKVVDQVA